MDPEQVETVIVELSLDHGTPVKDDVKAVTSALSLTGIKIIELTGGTSEAKTLKVGSEIPAGASTFDLISGKAEAISEKLELVLSNLATLTGGENQQRLMAMVDNTTAILSDVHGILADNRDNIAQTIEALKKENVWVAGIDMAGQLEYTKADFTLPTALVIGGEGKGLSDLVRKRCDLLVRIPMRGRISSLNASVAAALVLYEVLRQRSEAGK